MPVTDSPLRYPGGKTKLYQVVRDIVDKNIGQNGTYVEPFAGGAGLALKLLYHNDVRHIILNDIDENISCLWQVCLNDTESICRLIHDCTPSIEQWDAQRLIYNDPRNHSRLERAFATLFLNRCNVSGVISGGPIGGRTQEGVYKIDARYNPNELIRKIEKIGKYAGRIDFYCMDASVFLQTTITDLSVSSTIVNIDPPYVKKGPMLYRNAFSQDDHVLLSQQIQGLHHKWIVTYDECQLIRELYAHFPMNVIELKYSAGKSKSGKELIIYGHNIVL